MNGQPPAAPAVPPSVQRARQHPTRPGTPAWTGLWRSRILMALVGLAALAMVVAQVVATMHKKSPEKPPTESTMDPYWVRQTFQYKTEEPAPPPEEKKPVDTTAPEMAALRRQMAAIQQELEALKNRKTPATAVKHGGQGRAAARVRPRRPPSLLPMPNPKRTPEADWRDQPMCWSQEPFCPVRSKPR